MDDELVRQIMAGEEYDLDRVAGAYCRELCPDKGMMCALCYTGIGLFPLVITACCLPVGIALAFEIYLSDGGLQKIIGSAMMPDDIRDLLKERHQKQYTPIP